MIMGDSEEFECITETSASQIKKITKVVSMALQMLLTSSVYPLKPDLHTTLSLTTSNTAIRKGKKERQHTEGNLGTQDWEIVSGELETNASQNCFHKLIKILLKLK